MSHASFSRIEFGLRAFFRLSFQRLPMIENLGKPSNQACFRCSLVSLQVYRLDQPETLTLVRASQTAAGGTQ